MRKWILLFILGFIVFGAISAHADVSVTATQWISSNTATADTTKNIRCSSVQNNPGCKFHGVVVSSAGINSSIIIYNSSATAANTITTLDTTVRGATYLFDVFLSTGLTYTTVGTANLTILYAKPTIR